MEFTNISKFAPMFRSGGPRTEVPSFLDCVARGVRRAKLFAANQIMWNCTESYGTSNYQNCYAIDHGAKKKYCFRTNTSVKAHFIVFFNLSWMTHGSTTWAQPAPSLRLPNHASRVPSRSSLFVPLVGMCIFIFAVVNASIESLNLGSTIMSVIGLALMCYRLWSASTRK